MTSEGLKQREKVPKDHDKTLTKVNKYFLSTVKNVLCNFKTVHKLKIALNQVVLFLSFHLR